MTPPFRATAQDLYGDVDALSDEQVLSCDEISWSNFQTVDEVAWRTAIQSRALALNNPSSLE